MISPVLYKVMLNYIKLSASHETSDALESLTTDLYLTS